MTNRPFFPFATLCLSLSVALLSACDEEGGAEVQPADAASLMDAFVAPIADAAVAPLDALTDTTALPNLRDSGAVDAGSETGTVAAQYVLELLDIKGAESVEAYAITPDGSRVGGTATVRTGGISTTVASVWLAGTPRIDRKPLRGLSAGILAFDELGGGVGWTTKADGLEFPTVAGSLASGGWAEIPLLPDPLLFGVAIGAARGVVVGYATDADENISQPWVFSGGVTRSLGTFGGTSGRVTGMNAAGIVVGWSQLTPNDPDDFVSYGFIVPSDQTLAQATRILGFGGKTTFARAINNNGTVIGDSPDSEGVQHAFLWTAAAGIKKIHSPPVGAKKYVLPRALNGNDQVVGFEPQPGGKYLGWIWSPGSAARHLDDLVTLPAGWHIRDAFAIADDGTIVVVVHDKDDKARGAVLRKKK